MNKMVINNGWLRAPQYAIGEALVAALAIAMVQGGGNRAHRVSQ
jgi:hypothetical protein